MKVFSLKAHGRILWREASEQYTFCIGIFAMLVMMQASLTTMEAFNMIQPPTVAFGFGMALFMTAIYAAASSALLFTAEVDAGTFVFQRTKPIGWLTYLSGKLTWTTLSVLVLGLAAWIETSVWQGVFPSPRDTSLAFGVCGVGIAEGIAWGLIATMIFRGPLRAVIGGIALGSFVAYVSVIVHYTAGGGGTILVTMAYHNAAPLRLIVAAVVLAAAFPLARVWYRTGQPLRPLRWPHDTKVSAAIPGQWATLTQPCRGRSIRLLWQAWRQIRSPALAYWGVCAVALLWAGLYYYLHGKDRPGAAPDLAFGCIVLASLAILAFSSLLAGFTFGPDQKARFGQLARDGVSPWEIWLSRLAVMAAVLLLPTLIVLAALSHQMSNLTEIPMLRPLAVLLVMLAYFSVLVIGQACSMLVRSRIIALLAAPVMIGCFAFWIGLGVFWAGLGWKLGAAPMLLALVIGSRLLTGTRLRQDNSWRTMRVPVLLIVVAVVFSYQALAYRRTHEIQPYDSAHQADDLPIAIGSAHFLADVQEMAIYSQSSIPLQQHLANFFTLPDEAMESASLASHHVGQPWRDNAYAVHSGLASYGGMLSAEANLSRNLRYATRGPNPPNSRLRSYISFLEDWARQRPSHADWLASVYQRDMIWLHCGPVDQQYAAVGFHDEPLPHRFRWFSFERQRMLQLLDRTYRIAAERAEEYEKAVINDQVGISRPGYGLVTDRDIVPYDPARPIWYQAAIETLLHSAREDGFHLLDSAVWTNRRSNVPIYDAEAERRGTILYLALRMYYNDHGQLPESLDALVQKKYLDRLPVVPVACKPFYYDSDGADDELREVIQRLDNSENQQGSSTGMSIYNFWQHDPTAPFLWCPTQPWGKMLPASVLGWFIDLDFAVEKYQPLSDRE